MGDGDGVTATGVGVMAALCLGVDPQPTMTTASTANSARADLNLPETMAAVFLQKRKPRLSDERSERP